MTRPVSSYGWSEERLFLTINVHHSPTGHGTDVTAWWRHVYPSSRRVGEILSWRLPDLDPSTLDYHQVLGAFMSLLAPPDRASDQTDSPGGARSHTGQDTPESM